MTQFNGTDLKLTKPDGTEVTPFVPVPAPNEAQLPDLRLIDADAPQHPVAAPISIAQGAIIAAVKGKMPGQPK
ncbi:MAG: hypothetical protein J0M12_05300 [Deltaproteobacteria bacterium]|nr:hypothetical protein [Deltaproteobacteria bacterium]